MIIPSPLCDVTTFFDERFTGSFAFPFISTFFYFWLLITWFGIYLWPKLLKFVFYFPLSFQFYQFSEFLKCFFERWVAASKFAPDFTIVSAGFDAARGDPLGCCDVRTKEVNNQFFLIIIKTTFSRSNYFGNALLICSAFVPSKGDCLSQS